MHAWLKLMTYSTVTSLSIWYIFNPLASQIWCRHRKRSDLSYVHYPPCVLLSVLVFGEHLHTRVGHAMSTDEARHTHGCSMCEHVDRTRRFGVSMCRMLVGGNWAVRADNVLITYEPLVRTRTPHALFLTRASVKVRSSAYKCGALEFISAAVGFGQCAHGAL